MKISGTVEMLFLKLSRYFIIILGIQPSSLTNLYNNHVVQKAKSILSVERIILSACSQVNVSL